ncbi:MAG: ABC transporter substrate-binding protein [Actinomycetota bacterium]|nr:ABC transporter substrate-binding protein [Actinomycetota bacterium]
MTRRRTSSLTVGLAATALLASACGGGGGAGGAGGGPAPVAVGSNTPDNRPVRTGGNLALALAEDPDVLDPTLARTLVSRLVFVSMCEKLYDIDKDLNVVPQLAAAKPEISADQKTVTIKLRQGVKFNDGTPFDAAAVKKSLDRHRTLKGSTRTSELATVTSVDVVDPGTVALKLSKPYAPLTAQLADRAGMVMSPAQLDKLGDKFGTEPVCVGPFEFVSRTPGSEIVLQKSPDYYDAGQVKLDRVSYRIITDANARLANAKSNDVQVAERIGATDIPGVQADRSVRLVGVPSLGYQGITVNIGNEKGVGEPAGTVDSPLAKSELRKAFDLALDREAINKVVFAGQYTPGCSPLPPVSPFHDPSISCPRNLEEAKRLVAASGVPTPVPVQLIVGTSPDNLRLAQVVQSLTREAGFDVQVQPTEFASALDQADAGKFQMFQVGWSGRIDPDGNIYNQLHSGAPLNSSGTSDPRLDELLEQGRTVTDQAERKRIYSEVMKIAAENRGILYLYYPKSFLVTTPAVAGLEYFADGLPRLKTAGLAQ